MHHLSGVTAKTLIPVRRPLQKFPPPDTGKKRVAINASHICCLLFLALFILPPAANALCLPHLVSYLKLDEMTNSVFSDESPNGIGGSCTTCPAPTSTGRISYARVFSATSGSTIQIPYNSKLNWPLGHDFAIEFWVKHGTAAPGATETVIGRLDSTTQLRWQISMNTGGRISAQFIAADGSGSSASVTSSAALNDNTWHHIAFVRSGSAGQNRLYVDGQLSDTETVTYSDAFSSATAGVTIGGLNGGAYFNGTIDEIGIYRSVLTADQILQHYNDGMVGLRAGYCGPDIDMRIMPLGDSVTKGSTATITDPTIRVGYRQELYLDLSDFDGDGIVDYYFDFVGRYINGESATPSFTANHEGVGGETADEIAARVPDAFTAHAADVVLLHAGTNDLNAGSGAITQTVNDVETILDNIWSAAPNATVFLAQIINRRPLDSATSDFNTALAARANSRIAAGDKLVLVNMESALTSASDWDGTTPEAVHPSPQGYLKMAARWYSALDEVLPPSNEAFPTIISDGSTKDANVGELFTFQVESDGNPLPTYTLTTKPEPSATIGSTSGLISYTPSAAGMHNVSVKATNANGEDTFSFQIDVNTPPNATADQYGPVNQGELLTVAAASGVLANDSDVEGDAISAELIQTVSHGSLTLNSDGSFEYQNDGSQNSSDSFTYYAKDSVGQSAPMTVSLTIDTSGSNVDPGGSSGGGGGGGGCFISTIGR